MIDLINRRERSLQFMQEGSTSGNGSKFCEWEIPRETVGHISSAGCKGQKEVVTLAHNVFRDLTFDIARYQKKTSVKDFTTLGTEKTLVTEKTLGSLWEREYINVCSKEDRGGLWLRMKPKHHSRWKCKGQCTGRKN